MLQNPSAERNKDPILEILKKYFPEDFSGKAMDFSSGTGIQLAHFATYFPNITWQPTEFDADCFNSIKAYTAHNNLKNVLDPVKIDARTAVEIWANGTMEPVSYDFIININLIHISPWTATQGLFKGASMLLKPQGYLFTYGPYAVNGILMPESNVRFDQSLKGRNPEWGIRDVADIKTLAEENGLQFEQMIDRPANNKILVFRKVAT